MSHSHLEVIMPHVDDVKAALEQILAPFDKNPPVKEGETEDERSDRYYARKYAFWDWWVIGGRWSSNKFIASFDEQRLENFRKKLVGLKVTVSGFQCGKETLQPESQIATVDALWNESFPNSPIKSCPFFSHFNDQYKHTEGFPDILPLGETPKDMKCERVIVAGLDYKGESYKANFMVQDSMYNGVNYIDCKWDGTLKSALKMQEERVKTYSDDWKAKLTVRPDWISVTVDYHS